LLPEPWHKYIPIWEYVKPKKIGGLERSQKISRRGAKTQRMEGALKYSLRAFASLREIPPSDRLDFALLYAVGRSYEAINRLDRNGWHVECGKFH
jgi:hypothetical protein